ncbi:MAG: 50S ribosomal protein L4 [Candidatus Nanoarchaeia archaeon]
MKADVLDLEGRKTKTIELPKQFEEEYREDLIRKAVQVMQTHRRQPYGSKPEAGKRASAEVSRRRRRYRGAYGMGISRVPRKVMTKRGRNLFWVGAFAPGTVGGRRAHPPKTSKNWELKMNVKERRKAIRSAVAATAIREVVQKRGHKVKEVPIIITNDIENIKKTKELSKILEKIGLKEELERIKNKKIRAGKGKSRGRKYKTKKGPLIVVGGECELEKAGRNIKGVDIVKARALNAELLAPGTHPGRLTIYTENAIEQMNKENLFYDGKIEPKEERNKRSTKK